MAFDQSSVPRDLRPLNVARTTPDETRIAPVTTTSGRTVEGFLGNPVRDAGSPNLIPVYYPPTVSDAGFVGLGYSNAVSGVASWCPRMPVGVVAPPGGNVTTGYCHPPSFGARVGGNASDQASDEGGEDSVSGKKIKFLCSFGGKILPRPSDGMLRYVGGQTRIISVRRDVSFDELVQKMVDTYGQNVVIKYQLPDEELDALVSVSCPDDLENMMDEYEKFVERSSDGSFKLRVFLFSSSELDSSGVMQYGEMQYGELQDSGQRYFEAVNGIMGGVGGSIARKETMTSATSTQNSDMSGNEAIDGSGHCQGDFTGPPSSGVFSPKANDATTQEHNPRLVCVDPTPSSNAEVSTAPLGIQMMMSTTPQTLSSQPEYEFERSVPVNVQQQQIGAEVQQAGVNFQPPTPYLQAYIDPPLQETLNPADYVQVPSQMGYPNQLLGNVGPMSTHQQFHDNASGIFSHQFIPAVHMTMVPSTHVSMKPNMMQPMVQPQQICVEHHPNERTFGARVVQLPSDQSYNAYQAQVPTSVVGGGYGWSQVSHPEQVVFSEGWASNQQVTLPEKIATFKDCYMCEKALPHAHSDTVVQDQRQSPAITASDLNPIYHSLRLEDKTRAPPMNRAVVIGAPGEGNAELGVRPKVLSNLDQEVGIPQSAALMAAQNVVQQNENERISLQSAENSDHAKVSVVPQGVVGFATGVQSPYSRAMTALTQPSQKNAVLLHAMPPQYQVKQEIVMNKPVVNSDINPGGGMPFQMSDQLVRESPKDYYSKLPGIAHKEDIIESYDHLKHVGVRMENLQVNPPEVFISKEQNKSPSENPRKEDVVREPFVKNTLSTQRMVLDSNHIKPNGLLPSSNEVSYLHNFQPPDSDVVAQSPLLGIPTSYLQSNLGVSYLAPDEASYGNRAFSDVNLVQRTERIPPIGEWKENPSLFHNKLLPDNVASNGNISSSVSPSNRVGDVQDSSTSLFSDQDPWNLRYDTQFPPPRPTRIALRKEGFGTRDPFGENLMESSGELPIGNRMEASAVAQLDDGVYQPIGNMTRTTQGSAEELIKQELQAVAEGVAASVLQSSMPSNPDITTMHDRSESLSDVNQDSEVQNTDLDLNKASFEDIKAKLPEKTNLGFPVSDGLGRLQVIKNSDLEELRELGSGTFGTVYHGKWRGTDVAIKRINDRCFAGKPSEQERMRDDFWNEAIKLADLHHPNVVAFYGVVLDSPGGSVATLTEYMVNGSLRNALQKSERNLDKRKRLVIAMDVAFGMEYLHGKNIVHFDLKSDNLLVNLRDPHRPICKVGDLGLSKVKCQTLISGGVRGTLPWMAPELLNGSSSLVSEKVDVFSFGIVMWELLTREEPYADLHYGAIIGGIVSNTLRPLVPESCDPEWRSLMERCWSSETSERPSFTEIANELRSMAAKVPPKAVTQQPVPSTQPQGKS